MGGTSEVFDRFEPVADSVPVAVDVSRSRPLYPIDFASPVPFSALHDNLSMYARGNLPGRAPAHDLGGTSPPKPFTPQIIEMETPNRLAGRSALSGGEFNMRISGRWRPDHRGGGAGDAAVGL